MNNLVNEKLTNKSILELPKFIKEDMIKKQYGIYNHSGVQICSWNKKSLINKGVCYKEKFYGVDCHKCMQFSPCVMWCEQNCTFCWRPMENMKLVNFENFKLNEPKEIIDNLIKVRKKLLSGFGGNDNVNLEKLNESFKPNHYAISLSGEPTLYPKLNELVKYLKSLKNIKTIFVVSNGQNFSYFENLIKNPQFQPTQLYISIDAPNENLFKKINRSIYKDGWDRLNKSIKYFSKIETRKVFRITQIKGLNDLDDHIDSYINLIQKGNPDIIEIKGYMYLGLSRKRHKKEEMPPFKDIQEFANKLSSKLENYEIIAEAENSLLIILKNNNSKYDLKIE